MLELATVRKHCRIDADMTEDDDLLVIYSQAAAQYVADTTDRNLYATAAEVPEGDETALVLNDSIRAAMLLMVGHWYENREAVIVGSISSELPLAVECLLHPYREYGV